MALPTRRCNVLVGTGNTEGNGTLQFQSTWIIGIREMGKCQSDRNQAIGGGLLIGQFLAPWVTSWDIRQVPKIQKSEENPKQEAPPQATP